MKQEIILLCFDYRKPDGNELAEQLKNLLSSHHILLSDYMLYLQVNSLADQFSLKCPY
jgi:hypothetical protein